VKPSHFRPTKYSLEQCNLTGGKESSLAMSVFLIIAASLIWGQTRSNI